MLENQEIEGYCEACGGVVLAEENHQFFYDRMPEGDTVLMLLCQPCYDRNRAEMDAQDESLTVLEEP